MRLTFIYLFTSALLGQRTYYYVRKHLPRLGHDASNWPKRGTGALPDGYTGSGPAAWKTIVKKRGRPHLQWRILRIVAASDDYQPHEKRAIRLAWRVFGRACVNFAEGGDGFSSHEASAVARKSWADPDYRARVTASSRASTLLSWDDPAYREKVVTAIRTIARATQSPLDREGLAPKVGRTRSNSIPLQYVSELLHRPEGTTREEVADDLGVSLFRAGQLIRDVNGCLGYGIAAVALGRYRISAPPLAA